LVSSKKQSANVVVVNSKAFTAFFAGFKIAFNCSTPSQNCRSLIIDLVDLALMKISGCSSRIYILIK
jgi:hypothetical protein